MVGDLPLGSTGSGVLEADPAKGGSMRHPRFKHQEEDTSGAQMISVDARKMLAILVQAHRGRKISDSSIDSLAHFEEELRGQRQGDSGWHIEFVVDDAKNVR